MDRSSGYTSNDGYYDYHHRGDYRDRDDNRRSRHPEEHSRQEYDTYERRREYFEGGHDRKDWRDDYRPRERYDDRYDDWYDDRHDDRYDRSSGWKHDKYDDRVEDIRLDNGRDYSRGHDSRYEYHKEDRPRSGYDDRSRERSHREDSREYSYEPRSRQGSYEHNQSDRAGRGQWGDGDNEDNQRRDDQQQGHGRGQREYREPEPSTRIYIRDIPTDAAEDMLYGALEPYGPVASYRLVRDKVSGVSRGFAFVDFPSLKKAKEFMFKSKRALTVGGAQARCYYSEQRENTSSGGDWICSKCNTTNFKKREACFQCSEPKSNDAKIVTNQDSAARTLVLRKLAPTVTEDTLKAIFCKFGTLKSITLLKEKATGEPRGTAFVDYENLEDAKAAMQGTQSIQIDGSYPRISYRFKGDPARGPVQAPSSFSAAAAVEQAQWAAARLQMAKAGGEGLAAAPTGYQLDPVSGYYYDTATQMYWDQANNLFYKDGVYYTWNVEKGIYEPYTAPNSNEATAQNVSSTAAAAGDAGSSKPSDGTANAGTGDHNAGSAAKDNAPNKEANPEEKKKLNPVKATIVKKPLAKTKKINITLQKWNNKQAELKEQDAAAAAAAAENGGWVAESAPETRDPTICYLCQRKFNTPEALGRHQALSELHKTNLAAARAKGLDGLKDSMKMTEEEIQEEMMRQQKYKDRAAERRNLHGEKHAGPPGTKMDPEEREAREAVKRRRIQERQNMMAPPPPAVEKASVTKPIAESNIGHKMMKAMGWTEGTGLGSKGSGVVDPVQAQMLEAGSGLGFGNKPVDPKFQIQPGDSYKDIIKKKAAARLEAL